MWHPVRPTVWVMPPGPYSVEGGRWILDLDQGVFRVLHETSGWHSLGSYSVSGSRVQFFNDPNCMEAVGSYVWSLDTGQLLLEVIEDECGARSAFQSGRGMRARVLTSSPWTSGP
jgi:hypothetical protein